MAYEIQELIPANKFTETVASICRRHHQHGRWQARIGRVSGNKDLYLGTFSACSSPHHSLSTPHDSFHVVTKC
jgi:hypothetical protein